LFIKYYDIDNLLSESVYSEFAGHFLTANKSTIDKLDILLELAINPSRSPELINITDIKYLKLALYLEESKLIKSINVDETGIPFSINKMIISGFDNMDTYINENGWIYGDDIAFYYNNGALNYRLLNDKLHNSDLKTENPNKVNGIYIKGQSLLNYIEVIIRRTT
jgi:hypothetical protein